MVDPARVVAGTVSEYLIMLAHEAKALNELSDEFTRQVMEVEAAISKLNLGVTASVSVEETSEQESPFSYNLKLGFQKQGGKWCLVVEDYVVNEAIDEYDRYEIWPFKDAPRDLRLKVVDHIPELLRELVDKSSKAKSELFQKFEYARALAAGLVPDALPEMKPGAPARGGK